jgi:His/Glu/Gln/Arg/opine family amino acid ABC transporter permease subunit
MAIPVRMEETRLLERINEALNRIKQNGRLEEIAVKWLGPAGKQAVSEPELEKAYDARAMSRSTVARLLARGFAVTLLVGVLSLVLGFVAAIPLGAALNRSKGVLYLPVRGVVDFIRGTPVLVQLFFVHFGLPYIGITFQPMTSAIVTLAVNAAAYMAEVVRAGLMSVRPGQRLAGRALGLSRWQVFRLVVWPQAFRIAMPPLMNSVVALIKDTALVGIISVPEVLTTARSITATTFNPIYYFIVAAMFFIVTFPLMTLAGGLERRLKQRGFAND